MRATIKAVDSPDADPIETWQPATPTDAGALVTLSIGPDATDAAADSFDVVIGTPAYFDRIGPQRHTFVVDRWDWPTIKTELERRVGSAAGDSWPDVAAQLSRWTRWEFENIDETTRRVN